MEAMYHGYDDKSVHLDICVPRASYVANAFTNYLSMINFRDKNISVNYRETNSFDTIKEVYEGDANIGIIRFFENEENYFISINSAPFLVGITPFEVLSKMIICIFSSKSLIVLLK